MSAVGRSSPTRSARRRSTVVTDRASSGSRSRRSASGPQQDVGRLQRLDATDEGDQVTVHGQAEAGPGRAAGQRARGQASVG